jgi:hypothetical protein
MSLGLSVLFGAGNAGLAKYPVYRRITKVNSTNRKLIPAIKIKFLPGLKALVPAG